jgi:hypothetical protein
LNSALSEESSVEKIQENPSTLPKHPEQKQSLVTKRNKKRRKKKHPQNVLRNNDEIKELLVDPTNIDVLAKEYANYYTCEIQC